ncbi:MULTISPECIES: Lrp/AsnC family transcriptional regulator [unclassified Bacillus (in: firmicutes)]|uniref:Lrp/AsnC family transcriptional regulator n=1 Tax=unclassified Bacillus (in: firmicutes) TaxID=185979 RepID=UPI00232AF397|nr:Lrp/AsnC family transcriptional regulator [Bacillus sp. BP-3]MDC2864215.1 Lrp/AsnC family transcriptional regulator [Bacillus sp. BP-3]
MDQIDSKILELLQNNGRMSMVDLGKEVNMTQPAVKERVRKLEDKGVIENYRAVVSQKKLGKDTTAFILFQANNCNQFVEFCRQSPHVIDLYRISGQYNYLLKVATSSSELLETFSDSCNKYGRPTILMVLSTRFEQKVMLPELLSE